MPNGDNPYMTEYTSPDLSDSYDFDMPGLIDWLSSQGISDEYSQQYADYIQNYFTESYLPYAEMMGVGYGGLGMFPEGGAYSYQGISPEIMQALGGVFSPQDFSSEMPAPEDLEYQGQDWWTGIADSQLLGQISPNASDINQFIQTSEGVNIPDMYNVDIFDPESIASSLSQIGELGDDIRPGEIKALTPEMLEKTTSAYYNPYETAGRESLVEKLGKARGGVSTGGFAGSGARTAGLSGAERLYRGGYEDILGDIMKMRGGATENVLDTIYGWQELLDQP